jgi:hypothetical protein
MRIKMRNTESGTHPTATATGSFHFLRGHEYDVPEDLGRPWVAKGIAEEVQAPVKAGAKGAQMEEAE